MLVHCSTQHPSEMQHVVAHALGLPSHHVHGRDAGAWAAASAARRSQSALCACVAAHRRAQARPAGQAARSTATTT